jgi:hypothetical protein
MIKRMIMLVVAALFAMSVMAPTAFAAQELEPGCDKDRGTITCTTTDKPGKSDDVGQGNQPEATVVDETQGNTKNKAPAEQQDLADNECTAGSPGLCKQAERQ